MNLCKNPECNKELPEDKIYCNESCLRAHFKLKEKSDFNIVEEEWLGQGRRKRAIEQIMKLAEQFCPTSFKKFSCIASYKTGLSLRKITDDYLVVLLELGFLRRNNGNLELGRK